METQIRPARADDIARLVALSRETIQSSYSSFLGDQAVSAYIESGAVDQYVADNIHRCIVIMADGTAAGCCVTKSNLIDLMMIDVNCHRRGLGTRLLRHVEDALFEVYDTLTLESFEKNNRANAFYRKNGWRESRTFIDDDLGTEKIEFRKSRPNVRAP